MEERNFASKTYGSPRYPYNHQYKSKTRFSPVSHIVDGDFSKKRNLKSTLNCWKLPHPDKFFTTCTWENNYMMRGKAELNSVKNQLSDYNMKEWHAHTRRSNHAGDVVPLVRKKICPELLTQAWCKFYEICSSYQLVSKEAVKSGHLNSLHLCEAPGAFITSLNHFLKLRHPEITWAWRASTLNPYFEGNELSFMINDDRFILHTMDSWEFGLDQTGDMFQPDTVDRLIQVSRQIAPLLLVTADGSIDCQNDPGEQEVIVSRLHYYETLIALNALAKGGSFLLKMFTMFECQTISLLYLLACTFQTVDMVKPATSKEGNSEVYVVCLDFVGRDSIEPHLNSFRERFLQSTVTTGEKALFSMEQIPIDFMGNISECSDFFKTLQISVLKRNIRTHTEGLSNDDRCQLFQIRKELAHSYLSRCYLKSLTLPHYYLVGNDIIRQTLTLNLDARNEDWTYADRKALDVSDPTSTLNLLYSLLESVESIWVTESEPLLWFQSSQLHQDSELEMRVVLGKPITTVHSSKFCLGSLIQIWNKIREFDNTHLPNALRSDRVFETLSEVTETESVQVCDMRSEPYEGSVDNFQFVCLSKLVHTMRSLSRDASILILGLPLLTRFAVGLLLVLSRSFQKVCFVNPEVGGYAVLLSKYEESCSCLPALEDLTERMSEKTSLALHSLLPVKQLVADADWYKCILATNRVHIKRCATHIVTELLSKNKGNCT